MDKKSPLKFFLMVFGLSAPFWLLELFVDIKGLPLDIPITDIVAAFMPTVAACWMVHRESGRSGVRQLLARVFDWQVIPQKKWLWATALLPFLLFSCMYALMQWLGLPLPIGAKTAWLSIPVLLIFFLLGSLAEEVGYMGYAYEPMEQRWGALGAALLIGLPWAVWHYPSMMQQGRDVVWIFWGTLGTVAMRVLLVWVYKNTGRSLFACILFHAFYNLGRPLFPHDAVHNPLVDYPAVHYGVMAATAAIITFGFGAKTLTKNDG
jgi:membrane protease YdiL (CAAX protease family)